MDLEEFTCEQCKQTFPKARTDELCNQEVAALFPGEKQEDMCLVCEDCFIKIMDFNEPGQKRYSLWIDGEN